MKVNEEGQFEIDEQEEAEFIQNYLLQNGSGIIAVEDIKLIIEGQFEYMKAIGLVVEID